jgi:6-pyruvoyltetrahydropterin/6-carboxytetrahydropterin synthase
MTISMQATICRSYTFEAAHYLPDLPPMNKCKRMHGHSYKVEIMISGPVDKAGLVRGVEFGAMDVVMEPILLTVDHHLWNDKMDQPTVENIAEWFVFMVKEQLQVPLTVRVYEGPRSWAEVSS